MNRTSAPYSPALALALLVLFCAALAGGCASVTPDRQTATVSDDASRYSEFQRIDTEAAQDSMLLTGWGTALFLILGALCFAIVLFDSWGWMVDHQSARNWAYLAFVLPGIGLTIYYIWKHRTRRVDHHRIFCPHCGTYFDGKPEYCPNCGSAISAKGARPKPLSTD